MESRDSLQFQEAARWPCGWMAPARGVSGPGCGRVPPAPRRAVPLAELLGPELAAETRLISGMVQLRYDINYDINGYKL